MLQSKENGLAGGSGWRGRAGSRGGFGPKPKRQGLSTGVQEKEFREKKHLSDAAIFPADGCA